MGHAIVSERSRGSTSLSRVRAEVVRDYLLTKGVSPASIQLFALDHQAPPEGGRSVDDKRVEVRVD